MQTAKRNILNAERIVCSANKLIATAIKFIFFAFRIISTAFRIIQSAERYMTSAIRNIASANRIITTAKWNRKKGHHITAVCFNGYFRIFLRKIRCWMECFVIFVMAWCWCNATESKPHNVSRNFNRTAKHR